MLGELLESLHIFFSNTIRVTLVLRGKNHWTGTLPDCRVKNILILRRGSEDDVFFCSQEAAVVITGAKAEHDVVASAQPRGPARVPGGEISPKCLQNQAAGSEVLMTNRCCA